LFIAVFDMNVTPMHTSYIEVTVEILDSNDNKPRFEQVILLFLIKNHRYHFRLFIKHPSEKTS
jgi:hypothetical protein